MSNRFSPKIITANALIAGDVVYLTDMDQWSPRHRDARLITDEATATALLAQSQARSGEVVGVYLADARPGPEGPEPLHFREAFRATGPSNYPHGKQEHQDV